MANLDDLEGRFWDARRASMDLARVRDDRRRVLLDEARARIEAQLNEEFPRMVATLQAEADCQRALDDARIEAAKEKLKRVSNYGVLVEWKTKDRNWYNLEKRRLLYKTGRRAVVEMCTHETRFADNCPDYRRPKPGDLFLRRLKKNGEKSLQIVTTLRDGEIPSNWYPEGEKPEGAAPENGEEAILAEIRGTR